MFALSKHLTGLLSLSFDRDHGFLWMLALVMAQDCGSQIQSLLVCVLFCITGVNV